MVPTLLLIVIILCFVGLIWIANKKTKAQVNLMQKLSDQLKLGTELLRINEHHHVEYLGGHPDLPTPGTAMISVREKGIVVAVRGKVIANKFSVLKDIDFLTQDQISKDVTLTRLAALGVFALAAKKKRVEHVEFLRIIVEFNGISSTAIFKTKSASSIISAINSARIAMVQTT